mmetsp:Transcript_46978/g.47433  ORF Transcript_46978/g.47433 Transcript_46978/m.47433 type:complete len:145 (-) Transcript_46978:73-507(-)
MYSNGEIKVNESSKITFKDSITANGIMTSRVETLTRLHCSALRYSLLILQILLKMAEKETVKPRKNSHETHVQASDAISFPGLKSSILNGMMVIPMMKVPTHIIYRKKGCDNFTARFSRYRNTHAAKTIEVDRMIAAITPPAIW